MWLTVGTNPSMRKPCRGVKFPKGVIRIAGTLILVVDARHP